jgi:hypothetical protein
MSTSHRAKLDNENEDLRIARRILAALRAAGVEADLVEDIDDAPPVIPDHCDEAAN